MSSDSSNSVAPETTDASAGAASPAGIATRSPGNEHRGIDLHALAVRQLPRAARQQLGERIGGVDGAGQRPGLEVAPGEDEEHEHRDRVVVDLAAAPRAVEARDEAHRDAQGHGHVHPRLAGREAVPGRPEDGPGREEQHRDGDHEARDVEEPLEVPRERAAVVQVGREGEHHDLHHREAGHRQPPQGAPLLGAPQALRVAPGHARPVAGPRDHGGELLARGGRGVPDAHAPGGEVQARLLDARQARERRFDAGDAGRAAHALDVEDGFGLAGSGAGAGAGLGAAAWARPCRPAHPAQQKTSADPVVAGADDGVRTGSPQWAHFGRSGARVSGTVEV